MFLEDINLVDDPEVVEIAIVANVPGIVRVLEGGTERAPRSDAAASLGTRLQAVKADSTALARHAGAGMAIESTVAAETGIALVTGIVILRGVVTGKLAPSRL